MGQLQPAGSWPGAGPLVPEAGRWYRLVALGEFDLADCAELRQVIGDAVRAGRPRVVLDCADMTFMDAAVIGVLVRSASLARSAGGDLRLIRVTGEPALVLTIVGAVWLLTGDPFIEGSAPGRGQDVGTGAQSQHRRRWSGHDVAG